MKNVKKVLSAGIAAAMLAASLPAAVTAEEGTEAAPETVLYENNFNGADIYEAFPSYSNEYMSIGGIDKDSDGKQVNNTEGKFSIGYKDGYIFAGNTGAYKNGRTLLADFTKGGTQAGITGGAVKISYDFMVRNTSIDNANATGVNMTNHYEGKIMMGTRNIDSKPNLIVKNSLGNYDVSSTSGPCTVLETDKWYSLDIVMNLDKQTLAYYLDGEKLEGPSTINFSNMNNVAVCLNGLYSGFDNFKISKLNDASLYEFSVSAENYATGYADLYFPAVMDLTKGTFSVDGAELAAENVKWLSVNKVRLTADALNEAGTHTIAVDGVTDIFGVAPQNTSVELTSAELRAEEVLYENHFPNGADSVDWDNWKDYGAFEGLLKQYGDKNVNKPVTASFDGNMGIRGATGQWPTATQFCFDFTKSETLPPVNSGVYKFSWDFSLDGTVTSCDRDLIGLNMTNAYTGHELLQYNKGKFYIMEAGGYQNWDTGVQDLDYDKVYTIDTIIDFDADTVDFYLDGVHKLNRTGFSVSMSRFNINFCQCIDFFDNLKVSKLNKGYGYRYGFNAAAEKSANGYADVIFEGAMNTESGKFIVNGNEVSAENIKWLGVSRVRLYDESLLSEGVHTIVISDISDIYGVAPKQNSVTFETFGWEENYIIYENTFNTGAASLSWNEGESYNYGFREEESIHKEYPVINGNPGFKTGMVLPGRTFMVDFTKTLTVKTGGITSGKIKFSFDFLMKATDEEPATWGVNMKNFYDGNICAEFSTFTDDDGIVKGKFKTKQDAGSYVNQEEYIPYSNIISVDLNKLHTLDAVIDLDVGNTKISYYFDGEKLPGTTTYWQDNVPNISFCPNTNFKYFDNLKISWLKEGSFGVEGAKAPTAGDNYIDIYTTEAADITADKVTVNGVTPKSVSTLTVPGSYSNNSRYIVRAELDQPVAAGEVYEVALSADAVNFLGTAINNNHLSASVTVLDNIVLTIENGTVKAVMVNSGEAAMEVPSVVIADYTADGKMTSVGVYNNFTVGGAEVQVLEPGEKAELSIDISNSSENVKAFMLNNLNSLTPITLPAVK